MLTRMVGSSQRYIAAFKQGWNDVPYLYGTFGVFVFGIGYLIVDCARTPPGGYITRFKERYIVMRPDDERLIGYPKDYVTDNQLLK